MYFAIISGAISLLTELVGFINKQREIASQSKELTPEQDAELDRRLREIMDTAPWWTPSS